MKLSLQTRMAATVSDAVRVDCEKWLLGVVMGVQPCRVLLPGERAVMDDIFARRHSKS